MCLMCTRFDRVRRGLLNPRGDLSFLVDLVGERPVSLQAGWKIALDSSHLGF